ncbi:S-layer homology domain-containing protein, partial [Candidatus Dojkabacteria bacterium]|nr:S-layer homology domain-containing protein [Candidatus Dojkabacteria bacterium]
MKKFLFSIALFFLLTPLFIVQAATRRVNAPNLGSGEVLLGDTAIFWFGNLTADENYSDVRVGYNNEGIRVHISNFDRILQYQQSFSKDTYHSYDSVDLFLHTGSQSTTSVDGSSYYFGTQHHQFEEDSNYKVSFTGTGGSWQENSVDYTIDAGWRGQGPNDEQIDRGWNATYFIPFSSIGLSSPPAEGTVIRFGIELFDKDLGSTIRTTNWPETFSKTNPSSWGELHFGLPKHESSSSVSQVVSIKNGIDGAEVIDAAVGGHSVCGAPFSANGYFNDWPLVNKYDYVSALGNNGPLAQFAVQNQYDLGDWPCLSKYFTQFPLSGVSGNDVVSAKLVMQHFGNSLPSEAPTSKIQILTFEGDINEQTINWNNAPYASENISFTSVDPLPNGGSAVYYDFDVTYAVAEALSEGKNMLNLAVYSSDTPRHTGKYFSTSDAGESARPELVIQLGNGSSSACEASFPDICNSIFKDYIENLYNEGVVNGYSNGNYGPADPVTRAQMAKFVVLAFDFDLITSGASFPDVMNSDSLYPYIQTLKNKGIISGYGDGTFRPGEVVNREQVTKFVVNAMKEQGINT